MNRNYLVIGVMIVLLSTVALIYYTLEGDPERVTIEVTTQQFRFNPYQINVTKGIELTLRITSLDVSHGFQLEEFGLYNIVVPAGETVDVSFSVDKVGTFQFYCTVICGTGHADHLGVLEVTA